ncbi:MAG TPA: hypothetical protein VL860_14415 [Planctomycetota bacterium]|nr:hypothetical protein [Planctomycetota bacterium]
MRPSAIARRPLWRLACWRKIGQSAGVVALLGWSVVAAADSEVPALSATLPAAAPVAAVEVSAAAKEFVDRIHQVRLSLGDEDGPTRDKGFQSLQVDTDAVMNELFHVSTDANDSNEKLLLVQMADRIQARLLYEKNLLKIPVAERPAVDAMLRRVPGFAQYFVVGTEDRIKLLDALCASGPDAGSLAAFLAQAMHDKDPRLVTAVFARAAAAPMDAYLPIAAEMVEKGYRELYLPRNVDFFVVQEVTGYMNDRDWYYQLAVMIASIPGETADKLLCYLLESLTAQPCRIGVQRIWDREHLFVDLGDLIVKRGAQAVFPKLVVMAQTHILYEDWTPGHPPQCSSTADVLLYAAYRLIDKAVPARPAGKHTSLLWKDGYERLQVWDDFLVAWQADVVAHKANRDGLEAYQQWYEKNRRELIEMMAKNEAELRREEGKNEPPAGNGK